MTATAQRAIVTQTLCCPGCGESEALSNVQETERVTRYGVIGRDQHGLLVFDEGVVTAEVYLVNVLECDVCGWQDLQQGWDQRI
ncbi:hypothetical protein [Phycicoccus jejuensis]|uniref:hypothetical protein n=1 Tax=Phycicoccus jejuensis TaxID=367299 RepID=UPI0012F717D5|nr:hypothetical protein [Phycicoccus jejuensis]